jgi:predicted nucleotidyltransferase
MERDVRLAVLFGSAATGQEDADSDLDLLVVHCVGRPIVQRFVGV